jgi:hypothetical protein
MLEHRNKPTCRILRIILFIITPQIGWCIRGTLRFYYEYSIRLPSWPGYSTFTAVLLSSLQDLLLPNPYHSSSVIINFIPHYINPCHRYSALKQSKDLASHLYAKFHSYIEHCTRLYSQAILIPLTVFWCRFILSVRPSSSSLIVYYFLL